MRTFRHKPFFVGFHSDSPARQKAAEWPGVASLKACGFCAFVCEQHPSATGKLHAYPMGYSQSVPQPLLPTQRRVRSVLVRHA